MLLKMTMLCKSDLKLTASARTDVPTGTLPRVSRWVLRSGTTLIAAVSVLPLIAVSALAAPPAAPLLLASSSPSSRVLVSEYLPPGDSEPAPPADDSTTSTSGSPNEGDIDGSTSGHSPDRSPDRSLGRSSNRSSSSGPDSSPQSGDLEPEQTVGTSSRSGRPGESMSGPPI